MAGRARIDSFMGNLDLIGKLVFLVPVSDLAWEAGVTVEFGPWLCIIDLACYLSGPLPYVWTCHGNLVNLWNVGPHVVKLKYFCGILDLPGTFPPCFCGISTWLGSCCFCGQFGHEFLKWSFYRRFGPVWELSPKILARKLVFLWILLDFHWREILFIWIH